MDLEEFEKDLDTLLLDEDLLKSIRTTKSEMKHNLIKHFKKHSSPKNVASPQKRKDLDIKITKMCEFCDKVEPVKFEKLTNEEQQEFIKILN